MTLSELITLVRRRWAWNDVRYPGLPPEQDGPCGGDDDRSRFRRKHVLLHMTSQVGQLSAIEQECDHDPHRRTPARQLGRREQLAKLLIDVAQFADIEGITEGVLTEEVNRILKASNGPDDRTSNG